MEYCCPKTDIFISANPCKPHCTLFLIINHFPFRIEDSGSGSAGVTLNQRTIALDLEMLEVFARGRYGELRKAVYRGSMVAVKVSHKFRPFINILAHLDILHNGGGIVAK